MWIPLPLMQIQNEIHYKISKEVKQKYEHDNYMMKYYLSKLWRLSQDSFKEFNMNPTLSDSVPFHMKFKYTSRYGSLHKYQIWVKTKVYFILESQTQKI